MMIETYNAAWFIMFGFQLALLAGLTLWGRKTDTAGRKKLMTVYYIFLCLFYVAYKAWLVWGSTIYETSFWNELPLALCQVASLLALPGVLSGNKPLLGFAFFVGSVCSLLALLMPSEGFTGIPLLCPESVGFFGFHGLVFVQAVLIYTLRFYNPAPRDVPKITLLLALIALAAHGANLVLIALDLCPEANYFFTCSPEANPVLNLLYNLIPVRYVYLLPAMPLFGGLFALESLVLRRKNQE